MKKSEEILAHLMEELRPSVFDRLQTLVEERLVVPLLWPSEPSLWTSAIGRHFLQGYPSDVAFVRSAAWLNAEYGERGHLSFVIESRRFPADAQLKGVAAAARGRSSELRQQHIERVFARYYALSFRDRFSVLEAFVAKLAPSIRSAFPGDSLRVLVPTFPTLVLERVATQATFDWQATTLGPLIPSSSH